MKKLIQLSTIALLSISTVACSGGKTEEGATNTDTNSSNSSTTSETSTSTSTPTEQGKGTITLVCNGQTFVTSGNCNYSEMGEAIAITDSNNNANAVTLNIKGGVPTQTTTYTLADNVTSNSTLSMSFTRFPSSGKMNDWETKDNSGTMTMTVEGNKITCTFSNIPMDGSDMYNAEELAGNATCSGSFTLYK